jgi:hypothetical protein
MNCLLIFLTDAIMIMGIVMSLFFTIAGLYFVPSALGYALSQQLSGNRWLAIFQFRKVITFSEFSFVITFTI